MIALITTVLNEEDTIDIFLDSIEKQKRLPSEVIIVDGGSSDATIKKILGHSLNKKRKIKLIKKRGNRSVGRNEAIRNSQSDIIAISDAGCILDGNWLKNITKPFKYKNIDVVAGYYKAKPTSLFQKCLVPYVLVMPDKIEPASFLPATRSVAFRKSTWEKAGKFNRKLSHNEDYAFARRLQTLGTRMVFEKNAFVYWIPRSNLKQAFVMFFRFAYGDAESKIIRPKVVLIFARYIFVLCLIVLYLLYPSIFIIFTLLLMLLAYIAWSATKNYKYVKQAPALFWLPVLQFVSDAAVMCGSSIGFLRRK